MEHPLKKSIKKIILIGSFVENQLTINSDIDIAVEFLEMHGWKVAFTKPSPITGGDGNIEFLLAAQKVGT